MRRSGDARDDYLIVCPPNQGRIQPVSLGGAISVIFGSQVSVGSQVSFRIVQNHGEKNSFLRF